MWKYNNKIIRAGKAWVDSAGTQHPYNWMVWDADTKADKGLVWEDDPAPFDNQFYWSAGTDWMVIRLQEDSNKTLSTAVTNYRAAVRTASGTIETAIDNASDIDAFKALFDTPVDSDGEATGKPPISNWPDEL